MEHPAFFVHKHGLCIYENGRGVGRSGLEQRFQQERVRGIVALGNPDVVGSGHFHPLVPLGKGTARIVRVRHHAPVGSILRVAIQYRQRLVRGLVVHQNHFQRNGGLGQNAVQPLREVAGVPVVGHKNRNGWERRHLPNLRITLAVCGFW